MKHSLWTNAVCGKNKATDRLAGDNSHCQQQSLLPTEDVASDYLYEALTGGRGSSVAKAHSRATPDAQWTDCNHAVEDFTINIPGARMQRCCKVTQKAADAEKWLHIADCHAAEALLA